jgi:hypothetical protein
MNEICWIAIFKPNPNPLVAPPGATNAKSLQFQALKIFRFKRIVSELPMLEALFPSQVGDV